MKSMLLLFCLGSMLTVGAEEIAKRVDWAKRPTNDLPAGGTIVRNAGGAAALRIENVQSGPVQIEILRIDQPPVAARIYALRGNIRYENVQGEGYLEMWSVFPAGAPGAAEPRYFTRTLSPSGPMGKLSGSAEWRPFVLPFNRTGAETAPSRLEVNLVLPGPGSVEIGPLELVDDSDLTSLGAGGWWSERTGGLIGGFGGAFLGCFAGLLGWFASRKRARGFVLGASYALIALGAVLALAGICAVALRQPYAVWFPLALTGVLLLLILPFRVRELRKIYEQGELQKMRAADALNR